MYDIEISGTKIGFGVKGLTKWSWFYTSFEAVYKLNAWVHLVCVRDRAADSLRIYWNGKPLGAMKDDADGDVDTKGKPLIIGAWDPGRPYRGKIDDLRLYNYALTPNEIQALRDSYPTDLTDAQLVAHWTMNSNAGWKVIDEFGRSRGLVRNLPGNAWGRGLDGNAFDFGTTDQNGNITIDDNAFIRVDSSQSFSYSLLLSGDLLKNGNTVVMAKGDWGTGMYDIELNSGQIGFGVKGQSKWSWYYVSFKEMYKLNNWVHLVCVRDRQADSLRIYWNGVQLGAMKDDADGNVDTEGKPLIIAGWDPGRPYRGKIDDLRLYNYALSPEEIKALKDSYPADMTDGQLVGHWKMDSNAGWKVIDEFDRSRGLLHNMPGDAWVPGLVGKALNFGPNNATGSAQIEDNAFIRVDSSQSFTYSLLMSCDFLKGGNTVVLAKGDWGTGMYDIELNGTQIGFGVKGQTKWTWFYTSFEHVYKLNNWVHLACVRDRAADSLKIYWNGDYLGGMKDDADGNVDTKGKPLIIGAWDPGRPYKGKIDDLRLYNYALSAAEIKDLKATYPADVIDGQLVAHWKMNSNAGWKVIDELDHSRGLLHNMPGNAWIPSVHGNALDFSLGGDNAFVSIPDNDFINFDSTLSFTISALVMADPVAHPEEMHIVFKGATSEDAAKNWQGKWYALGFKSGEIRFAVDDNVVKTQLAAKIAESYPVKDWVHILAVRDRAADSLKLYMNGVMIAGIEDITELNIASKNLPLLLGNNHESKTHFKGKLDDVRMYNYAMSAAKVKDLYASYNIVSAVESNPDNQAPVTYALKQNYPNPFNPSTRIEFHLPVPGWTTIVVYNAVGQEVATLVNAKLERGVHAVTCNVSHLTSGVYFYKIKSGDFSQVRKMMLMK
jgi:hypothetical protein